MTANIPRTLSAALKAYELSPAVFLLAAEHPAARLGCFLEGTTICRHRSGPAPDRARARIDRCISAVVVVNVMIGLVTPRTASCFS